jgi:hypothetical protein
MHTPVPRKVEVYSIQGDHQYARRFLIEAPNALVLEGKVDFVGGGDHVEGARAVALDVVREKKRVSESLRVTEKFSSQAIQALSKP